jgi:hypothetical protein
MPRGMAPYRSLWIKENCAILAYSFLIFVIYTFNVTTYTARTNPVSSLQTGNCSLTHQYGLSRARRFIDRKHRNGGYHPFHAFKEAYCVGCDFISASET